MDSMKAIIQNQYGGPEVLRIQELQKPKPESNEILIRIFSVPITAAGSFMREGKPYVGRLFIGLTRPKSKIPGVCFSGEVEAIGSDVKKFKIGDKVFGETLFKQGTHAEYACVSEDDTIAIKPKNITHSEAAPICDGHLTSQNFIYKVAELKPNQKILVIGASGSLGTAAIQIAKSVGAEVTGVCSAGNIELVRSLGADDVIDYTKTEYTKGIRKYDVVYDTVGKSSFGKCKPILSAKGIYMSPVLTLKLLFQSIITSKSSKKKAKFSATGMLDKEELKKMLSQVKTLIVDEKLTTVIDRQYSFDMFAEAHSYVDSGRKRGNVILNVKR